MNTKLRTKESDSESDLVRFKKHGSFPQALSAISEIRCRYFDDFNEVRIRERRSRFLMHRNSEINDQFQNLNLRRVSSILKRMDRKLNKMQSMIAELEEADDPEERQLSLTARGIFEDCKRIRDNLEEAADNFKFLDNEEWVTLESYE